MTVGSYDGLEVCELERIYLLSLLANIIDRNDSGWYSDGGLIYLRNVNGQKMDHARKNVIKIFEEVGFKIEIQTHLEIVSFLDMTFNLSNGAYRPYCASAHPSIILHKWSNSCQHQLMSE